MSLKTILLSAASALILSAGAAAAAPAVAENSVNLRAGPGTQYPVVDTIPAGAAVDVAGCAGSWCRVTFNGAVGYASRNFLQMAGAPAPGAGVVAAAPGYLYDEPVYDYYDYGYAYGPSFGFYASPGYRRGWRGWRGHRGWNGSRVGTWQGGSGTWQGNRTGTWQGGRTGTWQGRAAPTGGARIGSAGGVSRGGGGMAPGSVSPQVSAPQVSAPAASVGGGAAVSAPPAGGAAGGAVIRR
ncbi:MAG: hypothetical protein E6G97_24810 [Alphaproteobacteria bacterium]|nr:MAG: hypothetical protein E6G97_24810 [Alphaproteobacteria bacterium]